MSTAHVEAVAFSALGLIFLTVSVLAIRRARNGGPRSQWRYIGLFGVALCAFLVVLNLQGVTFHSGPSSNSSNHSGGN